jgi:thiamine pyrophosphate-dependent acetolactate synthase large subunit-like protein
MPHDRPQDAAHVMRRAAPDIERPEPAGISAPLFGSDVVADALRATGVPFIALTPGASFRGLHDSLVNYLGNRDPQMLVCLHEEHAVALAHGYAKIDGKPLAVALHSNVGLMHATMAIFNAWCDRAPMIIIGATGPFDAEKRRPWIDWIHTSQDQGALVRHYVKWDAQPASPLAAREALWRAAWLTAAEPRGPVYLNLDVEMQEAKLPELPPEMDAGRYMPAMVQEPGDGDLDRLVDLLSSAKKPLLLIGRGGRGEAAWEARVRLAEHLGARVVTDLKVGAVFPTDHPLHVGAPGVFLPPHAQAALRDADLVISLDWVDLDGALRTAWPDAEPRQSIVHVSVDHQLHNGWSMDHQGLPPVDLRISAEPDLLVSALVRRLDIRGPRPAASVEPIVSWSASATGEATIIDIALSLRDACAERPVSLLHLPISWDAGLWPFRHPLDYIGSEGGGGIGAGPGVTVGAALGLRGSDRLPVSLTGDGDFIMGVTALWTATHYRIPFLMVVVNNKSYFNDEVHQERIARSRQRPPENRWIGQRLDDPEISIVQLASAQGATTFGPVRDPKDLPSVFREAIAAVERGETVVVDVRVRAEYLATVASAMTEEKA